MKKTLEERKVEALEKIAKSLEKQVIISAKEEDTNTDEWGYPRKYGW